MSIDHNHIHCILIINYIDKREETSHSPTLPDIICSFKSKCTNKYLNYLKRNNIQMPMHIWQRSFYDHVIRNNKSLCKIREYIVNNHATWDNDKYNPNKKSHNNSLQRIVPYAEIGACLPTAEHNVMAQNNE